MNWQIKNMTDVDEKWPELIRAVQKQFDSDVKAGMPDLVAPIYFMKDCIRTAMVSKHVMKIKESYYKEKKIRV